MKHINYDGTVILLDTKTHCVVASVLTNHSMSIDEILSLTGQGVNDEGQIYDTETGELRNAWYDDLIMK